MIFKSISATDLDKILSLLNEGHSSSQVAFLLNKSLVSVNHMARFVRMHGEQKLKEVICERNIPHYSEYDYMRMAEYAVCNNLSATMLATALIASESRLTRILRLRKAKGQALVDGIQPYPVPSEIEQKLKGFKHLIRA